MTTLRAHADETRAGVVLIDADAPGIDGTDMSTRIGAAAANGVVIVIANDAGPENVEHALEAGASGYICKNSPTFELFAELLGILSTRSLGLP